MEWLQQAASESVSLQRKMWEQSEKESLKKVKEAGVKINYPDKEPFAKKVEPMIESYRMEPELYDLVQRIKAVKD